jgi:hypothetical protein
MTSNAPLTRALSNPPALLLSSYYRGSLLLLCLKLPFCDNGNCFWQAIGRSRSYSRLAHLAETRLLKGASFHSPHAKGH